MPNLNVKIFFKSGKVSYWVYVGFYFLCTLVIAVLINTALPFYVSKGDSPVIYIAMLAAIIPAYLFISRVEKGKADISEALRWIVWLVSFMIAMFVLFSPVVLLTSLVSLRFGTLIDCLIYAAVGIVLVIALISILALINKSSLSEEMRKSAQR